MCCEQEAGFIYAAPVIVKGGRDYLELVDAGAPVWVPEDLPSDDNIKVHGINGYFKARVLRWGNQLFIPVRDFPETEVEEWL